MVASSIVACKDAIHDPMTSLAPMERKASNGIVAHTDSATSPAGIPPEQAEFLAQIRNSAKWKEMQARHQRLSARGALLLAISDAALPNDAVAIIRLGQAKPLSRYVVVSPASLNDDIYMTALLQARVYESKNEDDDSPVTITLYADRRIEIESQAKGRSVDHDRSWGKHAENRLTGPLLASARQGTAAQIHGIGSVVLVRTDRRYSGDGIELK